MAGTKKGSLYVTDVRRSSQDEVWFRFSLREYATPKFEIYDWETTLVKTLDLGQDLPPGEYSSRGRAYFWDRQKTGGGRLAQGDYYVILYLDDVKQEEAKFQLSS